MPRTIFDMHILLISWVAGLLLIGTLGYSSIYKVSHSYDDQIHELESMIQSKVFMGNIESLAQLWKNLGMLLQAKDLQEHTGMSHIQRDALKAFNEALRIANGTMPALELQVLYLKGVLLRTMGFGHESIEALNSAISECVYNEEDKSILLFNKAEALRMIGNHSHAYIYYHAAVCRNRCRTQWYYQYVNAYKEMQGVTSNDWLSLLKEIIHTVDQCECGTERESLGTQGKCKPKWSSPFAADRAKIEALLLQHEADEHRKSDSGSKKGNSLLSPSFLLGNGDLNRCADTIADEIHPDEIISTALREHLSMETSSGR